MTDTTNPLDTHGMTMDGEPAMPILVAEYNALVSRVNEAEARAAAPSAPADRAALRDRIADTLAATDGWRWVSDSDKARSSAYRGYQTRADAVLAASPAPADRAAILREAADALAAHPGAIPYRPQLDEDGGFWWDTRDRDAAADLLRRMADGAQQPETQADDDPTESVIYEVVGDWGVDSADSAEAARAAVAKWLRAYPKCGAYAQQRIVREWPDGSEFYGPWTDLPDPPAAVSQPGKARQADTAGEQPAT